jgi:hypothetical protein
LPGRRDSPGACNGSPGDSAFVYLGPGSVVGMLKKFAHPFALVLEGFVAGAILVAATTPSLLDAHPAPAPALDSSIIPNASR